MILSFTRPDCRLVPTKANPAPWASNRGGEHAGDQVDRPGGSVDEVVGGRGPAGPRRGLQDPAEHPGEAGARALCGHRGPEGQGVPDARPDQLPDRAVEGLVSSGPSEATRLRSPRSTRGRTVSTAPRPR